MRYLDSEDLTWRDLWVIVRNLPPSSALHKAIHGLEESLWTVGDYLLAQLVDTQAWLAWTKTRDGAKGRNAPKPVPRPGMVDDSKKRIGSGTLPVDEMLSWLGWESEPSLV